MSVSIASLNSGSNGNCYYIGNKQEAILVDAGISCRETERRMTRLGLDMKRVKAIFVSHEHTDHIKGVPVLARKYKVPVYITGRTLEKSGMSIETVRHFNAYGTVRIGDIIVQAFPKSHDACDPHSFTVSHGKIKIGVFTDIGMPCENLISHFQQCHAAFLEANYDEQLLEEGKYPYYLKNRIRGGNGHLSNRQALALFKTYRPSFMSHLLLSHLSKENNSAERVKNLFGQYADHTEIVIASRFSETPVYEIGRSNKTDNNQNIRHQEAQLTFF